MNRRFLFRPALVAALLFGLCSPVMANEGPDGFPAFVRQIGQVAVAAGVDPVAVARELASVKYDPEVIELDNRQPEHTITFAEYAANAQRDDRVGMGRQKLREYCAVLRPVEEKTGVPAEVIVALWGSETNYGRFKGNKDVLQSLVNLAYAGRAGRFIRDRRGMFKEQAVAALEILAEGRYSRSSLRGSYAGAFGHHQFMPLSFQRAAVDGDGDGRADIINNPGDSFASAAALLLQKGWQPGRPWGREVRLPPGMEEDQIGVEFKQPVGAWRRAGIVLRDGTPLPQGDDVEQAASLIIPDRTSGQAYLFYANAHAIWNWNNSSWFAIMTERISVQIAANARAACSRSPSP